MKPNKSEHFETPWPQLPHRSNRRRQSYYPTPRCHYNRLLRLQPHNDPLNPLNPNINRHHHRPADPFAPSRPGPAVAVSDRLPPGPRHLPSPAGNRVLPGVPLVCGPPSSIDGHYATCTTASPAQIARSSGSPRGTRHVSMSPLPGHTGPCILPEASYGQCPPRRSSASP